MSASARFNHNDLLDQIRLVEWNAPFHDNHPLAPDPDSDALQRFVDDLEKADEEALDAAHVVIARALGLEEDDGIDFAQISLRDIEAIASLPEERLQVLARGLMAIYPPNEDGSEEPNTLFILDAWSDFFHQGKGLDWTLRFTNGETQTFRFSFIKGDVRQMHEALEAQDDVINDWEPKSPYAAKLDRYAVTPDSFTLLSGDILSPGRDKVGTIAVVVPNELIEEAQMSGGEDGIRQQMPSWFEMGRKNAKTQAIIKSKAAQPIWKPIFEQVVSLLKEREQGRIEKEREAFASASAKKQKTKSKRASAESDCFLLMSSMVGLFMKIEARMRYINSSIARSHYGVIAGHGPRKGEQWAFSAFACRHPAGWGPKKPLDAKVVDDKNEASESIRPPAAKRRFLN